MILDGSSFRTGGAENTGTVRLMHTGGAIRTGGAALITGGVATDDWGTGGAE